MDHFLLNLSYSPAGWAAIVHAGESFDARLGPVRKLVAHLGGAFASFHFEPPGGGAGQRVVVRDKFATFGTHDLIAVLGFPDKVAAQAFLIALSSQKEIQHVELTPLMPFEQVVTTAAAASKAAAAATGYAGPGTPAPR